MNAAAIREIDTVCFVGAGTMGCANSLVSAVSGYNTVVYDIDEQKLAEVAANHAEMGAYLVGSGYCSEADLAAAAARITCTGDLVAASANADLVSESVIEELRIKRDVHADLDRLCPEKTILTTNTSALLVSDIEGAVERGERFAAMHSHLGSPLVDIVGGPRTSAATIDILTRYVLSTKCVPLVLKKENRGYVLNALLGPVITTAMMLVIGGVASQEDVDRAWMKHRHAPMGPFGMMDLFGLNVVYDSAQHRPPDPLADAVKPKILAFLSELLKKGELGAKSGKGFYRYPNPAYQQPGFLEHEADLSTPHFAMTGALIRSAVTLAVTGVAEFDEIDRAWTVGMSLDIGPFGILDEMGVDNFLELLRAEPGLVQPEEIKAAEQYLQQRQEATHVGA